MGFLYGGIAVEKGLTGQAPELFYRQFQSVKLKGQRMMSAGQMLIFVIPLMAVLLFLLIVTIRDSRRFVVVKYHITSPKLRKKCRIVMLSDLHNKEYGEQNERLLQAIREQNPDLILMAGDMVTANGEKTQMQAPLWFIRRLAGEYPVYYGIGNHEYRIKIYKEDYGDKYEEYARELKKSGVRLLENERIYLPEYNMEICGLEMERLYYKRFRRSRMDRQYIKSLLGSGRADCMELLIAHNPDYFEQYAAWGAELVLAGHVHGGVVRLPLAGGVISPSVHLFPKYDGGLYEEYGSRMILGRGLGMHTIPIRIFNPGELVVVELDCDA